MNENLMEIISSGKLREFILGNGGFTTLRPDEDYSRWFKVKSFYVSLSPKDIQKKHIEATVLNMIKSNDPEEKRIGILVGRVIGIPTLREFVKEQILDTNFDKLPLRTKDELCFSATLIQLREVELFLVKYFFSQGRLREFIFCSKTPPYIKEAKEDDIWRIDAIGKFYLSSSIENQKTILSAIESSLKDSQNFQLAVRMYLETTNKLTDFIVNVTHVLSSITGLAD